MSLQASYQLVNTWASGFKGEITLTNTGTEPIVDWRLPFTFSQEIEDIWRADIVSRDGASYTLVGKDYSDTIAPGESQTISFKAAGAPVEPVFALAGDAGEAPAAPTPAEPDPIMSPGAVNGEAPDGPVGQPGTDDGPAPANGVNVINVAAGTSAADLQAIIDDAPEGATVRLAAGEFVFDRTVTVDRSDIAIVGAGSDSTRIVADFARGEEGAVFALGDGTLSGSYNLAQDAQEGDTALSLSGSHDISAGDFIWIERPNTKAFFDEIGDNSWLKDKPLQTSIARVTGVDGDTLQLENGVHFDYDTGDATVRRIDMSEHVRLGGFSIETNLGEADPGDLSNTLSAYDRVASVHLYGTYDAALDDIEVHDPGSKAFLFEKTLGMTATDLFAEGAHNKGAGGNGYAFEIKDTYESDLSGLEDHGMRHSVIFGSWYSAANNTVQVDFTDRDINFHGGRDHGNVVTVDVSERDPAYDNMSSVVSYNIEGESWGAPTDPTANSVTFGRALGSKRDDVIRGNDSGAYLDGRGADDTLAGGAGADTLTGGIGDDILLGGRGNDVAVFSGDRVEYDFTVLSDGSLEVDGKDGTDRLVGVEQLRFDGGATVNAADFGVNPADASGLAGSDLEDHILGVGLITDDLA